MIFRKATSEKEKKIREKISVCEQEVERKRKDLKNAQDKLSELKRELRDLFQTKMDFKD